MTRLDFALLHCLLPPTPVILKQMPGFIAYYQLVWSCSKAKCGLLVVLYVEELLLWSSFCLLLLSWMCFVSVDNHCYQKVPVSISFVQVCSLKMPVKVKCTKM